MERSATGYAVPVKHAPHTPSRVRSQVSFLVAIAVATASATGCGDSTSDGVGDDDDGGARACFFYPDSAMCQCSPDVRDVAGPPKENHQEVASCVAAEQALPAVCTHIDMGDLDPCTCEPWICDHFENGCECRVGTKSRPTDDASCTKTEGANCCLRRSSETGDADSCMCFSEPCEAGEEAVSSCSAADIIPIGFTIGKTFASPAGTVTTVDVCH
jgi:hypothetical protein